MKLINGICLGIFLLTACLFTGIISPPPPPASIVYMFVKHNVSKKAVVELGELGNGNQMVSVIFKGNCDKNTYWYHWTYSSTGSVSLTKVGVLEGDRFAEHSKARFDWNVPSFVDCYSFIDKEDSSRSMINHPYLETEGFNILTWIDL